MTQVFADDREHRRGLVLGFTLAEVLLLILFLLLLALGSKLQKLDAERAVTQSELQTKREVESNLRDALRTANAALRLAAVQLRGAGKELETGSIDPSSTSELDAMTSDERKSVNDIITQAKTINPTDPIQVLREAITAAAPSPLGTGDKEAKSPAGHNWPPIIRLSEADGFYFRSGSAELSEPFRTTLTSSVMERLLSIIAEYKVDVIEVIGHTDEQPLVVRASNLDKTLVPYLQGQPQDPFLPSDNAGLGLARAAAVVRVISADPRAKNLRVLPLSGAQLIDLGDQLTAGQSAAPREERRRIEIRVRRSTAPLPPG